LVLLAFLNSPDPVLPEYWKDYPWCYLHRIENCVKLGFPTLSRWLLTGLC
jgi:hypothetical protein